VSTDLGDSTSLGTSELTEEEGVDLVYPVSARDPVPNRVVASLSKMATEDRADSNPNPQGSGPVPGGM
jgi:hypothetical protein